MFGVEQDTDFEVAGYIGRFIIRERFDGTERLLWKLKDIYVNADLDILYDIICKAPANIIHLPPPLTDEQREQLRAIWTLGGKWIAKDIDGTLYAYIQKPEKGNCVWLTGGKCFYILDSLHVASLVSWSDPEPYDIGKAMGVGE